ncbi:MAG: 6-hydroxymethylpterin diphosphokinase MptE-like protein [Candidatus Thorarchaeota archaeon]
MRWSDWRPIYLDIVQRLELDMDKDREATRLLTSLLEEINPSPLLTQLEETIGGKSVVICGAGPTLDRHIESLKRDETISNYVIMAADGAVSVLLENAIMCDVIVSDLDGNIEHLKEMNRKGALLIIHGHGDNMEIVKSVVPVLGGVLGSTQVEPTSRAFLWGGFTDGDRACHIASAYNPEKIIFAGMDFGSLVGKWSKPGHDAHFAADQRKRMKLDIAERLITDLMEQTRIKHTFLT